MRPSDQEARLVGEAVAAMAADRLAAGRRFYDHLFAIAPQTRSLFVADLDRQATKLVDTLRTVADRLDAWTELVPVVEALALRHLAYGVRPEDYPPVGAALRRTFRDLLGDGFTPAHAAAWERVYGALEAQMIAAAYRLEAEGSD
jgi:nitric oxide dioxygenase